jgi:pimeloyl-ACP methyl ester carboxylesterase
MAPVSSSFSIFVRSVPLGSEQIAVARSGDGWTISSTGRLGPPLDVVARRIQIRYTPDWRPIEFTYDGLVKDQPEGVHTSIEGTTATNEVVRDGQAQDKTDTIDPASLLVMPNRFFSGYEAVAARVAGAAPGTELPAYAVGAASFRIRVGDASIDRIETPTRTLAARRTHLTLLLGGAPLEADIWTDDAARLLRLSVPAQSLEVVREDIASVAARRVPISRPNDEAVTIPANGFSLAGTLSRPASAAAKALPAVVLVSGSGPNDRDELVFNIPVLGQIAGAIADAGFIVLRYDKRGVGQSGGRVESATIQDYVDDLRAAVKFLGGRKDVDGKRIAVIGHSEGGWVALLAAEKDKHIAAVGLLATPGVPGADLILAQQAHLLDRMKVTGAERDAKIDMQKKLQAAIVSGKGLDQFPPAIRKQADNAEFQSMLTIDPAKVLPGVRQPILIVQGELDTQVDPSNADKLDEIARTRKNAAPPVVVKVPGVNHLLVPAKSGEVDEYATLPDKHVSPAVTRAIVDWLQKTLAW